MSVQTKHEWMGVYSPGQAERLAVELDRQKKSRRDYLWPATTLAMDEPGGLVMKGRKAFEVDGVAYTEWADAELASATVRNAIDSAADPDVTTEQRLERTRINPVDVATMPLSPTAERQLAAKLGIPLRYIRTIRGNGYNDLASHNFTYLLEKDKRKLFIRSLDGRVRAVLSDSYKVMDNSDVFFLAAETFQTVGAQLWTARLWDDGFELFGVAPHISGEVRTDRTFDPGDGWQSRWYGKEGDVHNAAVRISNSETGEGGLTIKPAIMRRVCCNFNIWADGVGRIHVGRRMQQEGLVKHLTVGDAGEGEAAASGLFSEETRQAEARTIWLKCRDVIKGAFDAEVFKRYIDRLNQITQTKIEKPEEAVANVVKAYELSESRKNDILRSLLGSGDFSRYGLVQAVTNSAHSADTAGSFDEASGLESLGGALVEMKDDEFAALVGV
jgi:hypothetical protein